MDYQPVDIKICFSFLWIPPPWTLVKNGYWIDNGAQWGDENQEELQAQKKGHTYFNVILMNITGIVSVSAMILEEKCKAILGYGNGRTVEKN